MRRKVGSRLASGLAALVVALALPVGVHGLHEACASAVSGPTVAVVVDFGDVSGQGMPPGGVESRCVGWSDGYRGFDALDDAGYSYTLAASGLVCSINGYPAAGCGERTGDRKYVYWSYWKAKQGAGSWTYSTTGPATKIKSGGTEGWHLVEGAGSPNDPPPRAAAAHDATCVPTDDPPASPDGPFVAGDDASGGANDDGVPPASTPTTNDAAPPDAAVDESSTSTDSSSSITAAHDGDPATDDVALAAASPAPAASGTGAVVGVVVVLVLIAAIGGAAYFQSRRRSG